VYRSTSDVKGTFDYIVCAHKAINQSSVPPLFQANTKPSTTFVLIQNGVGNEDPFRQNFPSHTIISCVAWTGAVQNTPGVISHGTNENLEIGLFPNTAGDASADKQRLQGFAGLLRTGGTKFSTEENIQVRRWEKVVWNAAWNPLTTLSGMEVQPWLRTSDEAMDLSKRLMEDVIAVGRRVGVPLKDGLADELIAKVQAMPNIFSSMYVDAKEGRPLEMDVIVGVPMAKAKELGMDVPALSAVYALTKAVDQRLRSKAADE
jgi:ATP-dependent metalloprotease